MDGARRGVLLEHEGRWAGEKKHLQSRFGIRRFWLGWLSVRFDGGPVYFDMVEALQQAIADFGYLVRRGERLSAEEWLHRINTLGLRITPAQLTAIETLMRNH
jgi:hypothetical protein